MAHGHVGMGIGMDTDMGMDVDVIMGVLMHGHVVAHGERLS